MMPMPRTMPRIRQQIWAPFIDQRDGRWHYVRPLGDTIIVKRDSPPERTKSGLIIRGIEWPARGRVQAVGPGKRGKRGMRVPIDLRPGDEVAFDKWASEIRLVPGTQDILIIDYDRCYLRIREAKDGP